MNEQKYSNKINEYYPVTPLFRCAFICQAASYDLSEVDCMVAAITSEPRVAALCSALLGDSASICSRCFSHRWPPLTPRVQLSVFPQRTEGSFGEILILNDDFTQELQPIRCSTCDKHGRRNLGFASCYDTTVHSQLSIVCLPRGSFREWQMRSAIHTSQSKFTPFAFITQDEGANGRVAILNDVSRFVPNSYLGRALFEIQLHRKFLFTSFISRYNR